MQEKMSDASSNLTERKDLQVPSTDVQDSWDIQWRRNKVMELLSQGKTQREIAKELKVHESTISRDLDHIQEEIDEGHKHWVQHVFRENQLALVGLNEVLKDLWRIARDTTQDMADRMKAYLLIMQCHNNKLTAVYNKQFTKALKNQYEEWLNKEENQEPQQSESPRPCSLGEIDDR